MKRQEWDDIIVIENYRGYAIGTTNPNGALDIRNHDGNWYGRIMDPDYGWAEESYNARMCGRALIDEWFDLQENLVSSHISFKKNTLDERLQ